MATQAIPYEESDLYKIRHSCAHVLAEAMLERFPGARLAIGPPIEDGFYYDFDLPRPLNDEDLRWVEKRMRHLLRGRHAFTEHEISAADARKLFAEQPYKLELIDELAAEGAPLTVYTQSAFTDLCRGPHVEHTGLIDPKAVSIRFKPPAGAYWRGDEKRAQLTRVYGTAWENGAQLQEYLQQLEEAKRRDHRVLGERLGLFTISPLVGKGLPLFKPRGAILRDTLERWLRDVQIERGYEPVVTPHIGRLELYETSGHYPFYSDSQYEPLRVDDERFLLKPMNCPHHVMIYKSEPRSYRDLPQRYAEFGTVYRYEQSGELHGLTRVRGFTVDDAHLFVTPEQLIEEFQNVVRLIQYVFRTLDMRDFRARIGIRDDESEKYVGTDEMWAQATSAIVAACEELALPYVIEEGEAAFYGAKLDFIVRDVLKREWQLGTVQVDYNLPERFELEYVDANNDRRRPIMIHRAPFGSLERFLGVLIEHFAGEFPLWLSPLQAVVIPIREQHYDYAREVETALRERGLRANADLRDRNMRNKIREQRAQRVPYLLIVGDRDVEARTVSVRLRDDTDLGARPLADFAGEAARLVAEKSLELV